MALKPTTHMPVILNKDGLAIAQDSHPEFWINTIGTGNAADYIIETDQEKIRGWESYLLIVNRRGYGMTGFIARSIRDIQALVDTKAREMHEAGWEDIDFPAFEAEYIVQPILQGLREALNCTDSTGMDYIRGDISQWMRNIAKRIGVLDKNGEF